MERIGALGDDFLEWAFDSSGKNPLSWKASADDLLLAAAAVKGQVIQFDKGMHSLAAVHAMLLGFAIECLLKGFYIKNRRAALTEGGRYVGVKGAGDHILRQLAEAAGYDVTDREQRVLDKLSAFVLFAGRYPISTHWRQMRPTDDGGPPGYIDAGDLEVAEALAKRLQSDVLPWS